jgi:MFS family permease
MIYPILPIFLSSTLGLNKAFIGLIEAIAESTAGIAKFFSGWFSDKFKKRKPVVLCGYLLSAISKPFFAVSKTGYHALFIRFSDRLGKGIRTPPRDALIADSATSQTLGRAFGFHRSMDSLGAVIGPLICFLIFPIFKDNLRGIFLVASIPAFLAVVIIILFVIERRPKEENYKKENFLFSLKGLNKEFKIFLLVTFIFTLGNSSDAFLILRAQSLNIPNRFIPILWLIFNSIYSITSIPSGILADRIGKARLIILGFIIYSLVYMGFAFANSAFYIWLLFSIYGIYYGITDGLLRAYVASISQKELLASSYGIFHTVQSIAVFIASLLMGLMWQFIGLKYAFLFCAFISFSAAIIWIILKLSLVLKGA